MSKYSIIYTNEFKKSYKLCKKRGLQISLLEEAIEILAETGTLPEKYRAHTLSGNYAGYWECHIKGDWLLIWKIQDKELVLILSNTGTHSDLFK